jgi:undecaprenyl diphosphate synthase
MSATAKCYPEANDAASHDEGACMPAHIAIIMDGNARWAKKHNMPIHKGHQEGAEALRRMLHHCKTLPFIDHVTVYAFSQENWKRPKQEIADLMQLLRFFFKRELKVLLKENIRIRFIGERKTLDADIRDILQTAEEKSAENTRLTLTIAISYGSRQEIASAAQALAKQVLAGNITPDDIDVDRLNKTLQTQYASDPDLLIRTGGEQRLSNFLLWQSAYTELYFCDALWPEFDGETLDKAIEIFASRQRRFGGRA